MIMAGAKRRLWWNFGSVRKFQNVPNYFSFEKSHYIKHKKSVKRLSAGCRVQGSGFRVQTAWRICIFFGNQTIEIDQASIASNIQFQQQETLTFYALNGWSILRFRLLKDIHLV